METVEVQTAAAGTTPAGVEAAGGEELGKVRELVLKAHPDVVPDLVRGSSVDELIASVEPARSAYQRIAEQVRQGGGVAGLQGGGETAISSEAASTANDTGSTTVVAQPPLVPAGGATNVAEPGDLGPTTKIAQALAARKTRG
jgi:hypothetical protein